MSRMVSKLCKINMATALKVHFGTCPFVQTRPFRNIILSWQIVEMGLYYTLDKDDLSYATGYED